MRFPARPGAIPALVLLPLTAVFAGCSASNSQSSLSSANLAPVRDEPRYDSGRNGTPYALPARGADRSYAARQYADPGTPTPRQYAAYDSGPAYAPRQTIQTGSLGAQHDGPRPYDPDARWQQPSSGIRAASPAPEQHMPHMVEVRQGDTLYGLSRRYNIPVGDLVAANRLPNERIAVGQRLVIPTRYR